MVAVTPDVAAEPPAADVPSRPRPIGLVPSASMITGAAVAVVWFWIPLGLLAIAISSIPSVIGFVLAGVAFVYLMRGVERFERLRSGLSRSSQQLSAARPSSISASRSRRAGFRTTRASNAGRTSSGSTSAAPGSGRPVPTTTSG